MNRKQELYLINLGLEVVLDRLIKPKKSSKRGWTKEQKAKFKKTMEKKWKDKKKS